MQIIVPETLGEKTPKEMMSVKFEAIPEHLIPAAHPRIKGMSPSRPVIRINFSSLDLLMKCMRLSYYGLERNMVKGDEAAALVFGSAIHKGLEKYYTSPISERLTPQVKESVMKAFYERAKVLELLDISDKRHPINGEKLLNKYLKEYADDGLVALSDDKGPLVERTFEFTMVDEPQWRIVFFGTIDAILQNEHSKQVYVVDHKTTSSLGSDFLNRMKPNFQYSGYTWLIKKNFPDLNIAGFMVNGLQVAKTKADLNRQYVNFSNEDFDELIMAVKWNVSNYLLSKEHNQWPMSTPNACTQWGGCTFRDVCANPASIRETMLTNLFTERKSIDGQE